MQTSHEPPSAWVAAAERGESGPATRTPSTLTVSLGDGTVAAATLTLATGAGATGAIVGHAAAQSGVDGTILLGTANQ